MWAGAWPALGGDWWPRLPVRHLVRPVAAACLRAPPHPPAGAGQGGGHDPPVGPSTRVVPDRELAMVAGVGSAHSRRRSGAGDDDRCRAWAPTRSSACVACSPGSPGNPVHRPHLHTAQRQPVDLAQAPRRLAPAEQVRRRLRVQVGVVVPRHLLLKI